MNPGCPRTLHPRISPRMNLRVQAGIATLARRSMLSQSLPSSAIGKPTAEAVLNQSCIFCRARAALQLATGSPTERDIRTVRSVEASVNLRLICGYHQSRCIRLIAQIFIAGYARNMQQSCGFSHKGRARSAEEITAFHRENRLGISRAMRSDF